MQVLLENIAFNHDSDLSKTGSFFLRRNETQIVPIPEWRNESCSNPERTPAGYVISELPATLTIKASFRCDVPDATIRIKAVESGSNILGAVQARLVSFQNGRSGLVAFDLPNARSRIIDAGISVSDITWDWQFSENANDWTDFQTTEHRIYTVLEMPNEPWKPGSNNATEIHVPWTEVLDYACEWAAGMKVGDEAAEAITRRVFRLGQEIPLQWTDGNPSYTNGRFNCTAFLELLNRGIGESNVNCDDCATIVSTFSNVLGCNLYQSEMGYDFTPNPILLIGHTKESNPRFFRHVVAWKLNCDASAALFDACLQVDYDGNPKAKDCEHKFIQPTNLVFSGTRRNSYRFCLFAGGVCDPKPCSKKQRPLGSGVLGESRITNVTLLDILKRHYEFNTWPNNSGPNAGSSDASGFDLQSLRDAFEGWTERKLEKFENERFSAIEVLLKRAEPSQELVKITVYQSKPVESPNELLLQLLGHSEALHFERMKEPAIGDVSFVGPDGITVLFRRRRFVSVIRSVGIQRTPVIALASETDLRLRQQ